MKLPLCNGSCKREDSKISASRATHPEGLTETRLFGMFTFSREGKANSGAGRYTYRRKNGILINLRQIFAHSQLKDER
jgi:hypothetical protein